MVYKIDTPEWLPDGLELWFLAKITGAIESRSFHSLEKLKRLLVTNEGRLYRDLARLDSILGNGTPIEELRVCRDHDVPQAYKVYTNDIETRFRPYFHERIKKIKFELNERVDAIEERQDLREGYVGSN